MSIPGVLVLRPIDRLVRRLGAPAMFAASMALSLVVPSPVAAVGPQDRRLTNARSGISVEAPAGWTLSQHTGYGDTVVLLLHPDGSRISVTAALTSARDAVALFAQNRPGLAAEHLEPSPIGRGPRGSLAINLARSDQGSEKVRQLYLVRDIPGGRQAIVLTLIGRADSFATHSSALDFVATRLGLDDPATPVGSTRANHLAAGSAGSDNRGGQTGRSVRGVAGGRGGQGGQSEPPPSGSQTHTAD